jgi:hypothetical protein
VVNEFCRAHSGPIGDFGRPDRIEIGEHNAWIEISLGARLCERPLASAAVVELVDFEYPGGGRV